MDIFSSLKDSGKNAVQRTREMAEVSRLNSSIASLQKEMDKCYLALGQQLVDRCIEENAQLDDVHVSRVIELRAQIADLQLQQARLRGVVTCANCGAEVDASAAFCNSCGAAMPRPKYQASANMTQCPNCGANMPSTTKFCIKCGTRLPERSAEAPAAEPEPEAVQNTVCPSCGTENAPGDRFCFNCGSALS